MASALAQPLGAPQKVFKGGIGTAHADDMFVGCALNGEYPLIGMVEFLWGDDLLCRQSGR